ncbi:MAG: MazG nucleotide pyrophosphohydrolase domain-containing protein [Elusimicrobiota bacterium]|jgi:MazG family protein
MRTFDRLVKVVARLRGPGGCPWDRKQTHRSLLKYLHEESREFAEAVRKGDARHMEEELGDVLLQVVLHAELAREKGLFDINAVARTLTKKLIRRHPHVFGGKKLKTPSEVVRQWAIIKAKEKQRKVPGIK